MARRLRTRNTVSPRLKQRYRQLAIVFTFAGLISATWFIYEFIGNVKSAKAESAEQKTEIQNNIIEGFAGRKKITVNPEHLKGKGNILNMPILISLRSDDLKITSEGGKVFSREGNDIVFTAANGKTIVPFQIERFDPFTGKLLAWIRPSTISDNPDLSTFWMYFGNTDANDSQSKETFGNPFAAVWHFNGSFQTSSPVSLAGEYKGAKDEEGRFGGGKDFLAYDKSTSVYQSNETVCFNGNISVSAWIKLTGINSDEFIFTNATSTGGCNFFIDKEGKLVFEISGKDGSTASVRKVTGGTILEKDKWYQVSGIYSQEKDSLSTYVNGTIDRSIKSGVNYAAGNTIVLGADVNLKTGFFNGIIDELRIANSAWDNTYIALSYASESDPESFFTLDGEEVFSASPRLAAINSFEATVKTSNVTLNWQTDSESNLDYFTVERSSDGKDFQKVSTQFAKGNSDQKNNYFLLDPSPVFGNAYYRLKYTSFKGESDVSNIISVHFEMEHSALNIRSVEPNPFKSGFSVVYNSLNPDPLNVNLTSLTGKVVYTNSIKPENGKDNLFEFRDQSSLAPGIYFLNIAQGGEERTIKLVKRL